MDFILTYFAFKPIKNSIEWIYKGVSAKNKWLVINGITLFIVIFSLYLGLLFLLKK